ncbi:hypothetical protein QR680_010432 [Steinernema hermaphroditum]|uniref:TIL domain-containing protein n=1 Tax=Steinernema hermaphroditum TaxID=289476 RepID=A0AA39MAP2_9BILA|nr:hypothetical protein QR680_010432 [Steinernema hermaphroditum]
MLKLFALLALLATLSQGAKLTRDPATCRVVKPFLSWFSDSCTFKNVCINGKLFSQPYRCPKNAHCSEERGSEECACDDGFQWDDKKQNCVDPKNPGGDPNAPCLDSDGRSYKPGLTYFVGGCRWTKLCLNGTLYTQCYECPQNAYCGQVNGSEGCVCDGQFHWDANKKNCIA